MPSRQPKGRSSPASSPATRIGLLPSALASRCRSSRKLIVAALALLDRRRSSGWKRSMWSWSRVAVGAPSARRSRRASRAGPRERLALAPVRAELVEVGGLDAALLAGELLVEREASCCSSSSRSSSPKITSSRVARGVDVHDVVERVALLEAAQHAHDRRDAAAGADEQELLRAAGRAARTRPRRRRARRCCRARPRRTRYGETTPSSTFLSVIADAAVRALRGRGQRVGAPVAAAVDVTPIAQVLARLVARPTRSRA